MGDDNVFGLKIKIDGSPEAVGEINKVTGAIQSSNAAAQASGGGLSNFGSAVGGVIGKLLPFAAAAKVLSSSLSELAEGERATVTLRKFGISAQEAAESAELLSNIAMFKDGDDAAAAEIFGKVMSGNVRELHLYGIELADAASKQEKLNALQELGARGVLSYAEKNDQLLGSWAIMWEGLSGKGAGAMGSAGRQLQHLIGGFNEWAGFTPSIAEQDAAWEENQKAIAETERRQKSELLTVKILTTATSELTTQVDEYTKAQEREAIAAKNASAESLAKEKALVAEKKAFIDLQVAQGKMSPAEGERAKGKLESDQAVAEKQRAVADTKANIVRDRGQETTLRVQKEKTDAALEDAKQVAANTATETARKAAQEDVDKLQKVSDDLKGKLEAVRADIVAQTSKLEIERSEIAQAKAEAASTTIKSAADSTKELSNDLHGIAGGVAGAGQGAADAAKRKFGPAAEEYQKKVEQFRKEFGTKRAAQDALSQIEAEAEGNPDAFDSAAEGRIRRGRNGQPDRLRGGAVSSSRNASPLDGFQRDNARRRPSAPAPVAPAPAREEPAATDHDGNDFFGIKQPLRARGGGDNAAASAAARAATAAENLGPKLEGLLTRIASALESVGSKADAAAAKATSNQRTAGQGGG